MKASTPPAKADERARRERRLAEALRANLRRRKKAESRREEPAPEPPGPAESEDSGGSARG